MAKELLDVDINNSWQLNKSVIECNEYMLKSQIASDVTFVVYKKEKTSFMEEPVIFKAHKYVLLSRSPEFQTMFLSKMAEKDEVSIKDVHPDAFRELLQFIYTDKCEITGEVVMFLTYAAKKYMLPALNEKCVEYLNENLDVDNACIILEQALFFQNDALSERCLDIVRFNASEAFKSASFTGIRQKTLEVILKCEELNAEELEVFSACLNWAKHQCAISKLDENGANLREILGSCLFLINFPTIKYSDFSSIVSVSNILKPEEELPLIRYLCCPDKHDVPKPFNSQKRVNPQPITIADVNQPRNFYAVNSYDFTITVNRPVKVLQFYFQMNQCPTCGFGNTIIHDQSGQELQGNIAPDNTFPNNSIFKFRNPFVIKNKITLTMQISHQNDIECYRYGHFQVSIIFAQKINLKQNNYRTEIESQNNYIPIYGISVIPI